MISLELLFTLGTVVDDVSSEVGAFEAILEGWIGLSVDGGRRDTRRSSGQLSVDTFEGLEGMSNSSSELDERGT